MVATISKFSVHLASRPKRAVDPREKDRVFSDHCHGIMRVPALPFLRVFIAVNPDILTGPASVHASNTPESLRDGFWFQR